LSYPTEDNIAPRLIIRLILLSVITFYSFPTLVISNVINLPNFLGSAGLLTSDATTFYFPYF